MAVNLLHYSVLFIYFWQNDERNFEEGMCFVDKIKKRPIQSDPNLESWFRFQGFKLEGSHPSLCLSRDPDVDFILIIMLFFISIFITFYSICSLHIINQ